MTGGDPARVETATVLEAARAGDEVAVAVVDEVADRMAHAVAALAGMLNPELVVISGAVADDGDLFLDRIRARLLPDLIDSHPGWPCPASATRPWSPAPSAWPSTMSRPASWAAPAPPTGPRPRPWRPPRPSAEGGISA